MNYSSIGNSTWRYGVWSVAGFPRVFYKLWRIGVTTRHLEVLNQRIKFLWWVYVIYCDELFYFYLLAHPICLWFAMIMEYVRRKHMMLQVVLVRLSIRDGLAGKSFVELYYYFFFYGFCKTLCYPFFTWYLSFINCGFWIFFLCNKRLNFPVFLGIKAIINEVLFLFLYFII